VDGHCYANAVGYICLLIYSPVSQVVIFPFHLLESDYMFVKNSGPPGMASNDVGQHIQQLSWAEVMLLWETCKDYPAAIQLNRDFLRGGHSCTPYHGPLNTETFGLLENLHRLHDFGLLTNGSQPSKHNKPFLTVDTTERRSEVRAILGFTDRLASFIRRVEHLEGDLRGASKLEEVGDHVIEPTSCRGQMGAITLVTAKLEEAKSRVAGLNVSSISSMWTLYVD